jgi:hypothetical protein
VGYALGWSGQYESAQKVKERLTLVIPVTLLIIFFLLYLNTRSIAKTLIVILVVPFSVVDAIWAVDALDYNMSIAVWVGIIALLEIDAETGVFLLLYLDLAYHKAKRGHPEFSKAISTKPLLKARQKTTAPEIHDLRDQDHRFSAETLVHGHRLRNHEAHRRSHNRRHLHFVYSRTAGLSRHLRGLQRDISRKSSHSTQKQPAATRNRGLLRWHLRRFTIADNHALSHVCDQA